MKKRFLGTLIFACALSMSVSACSIPLKPSGSGDDTSYTENEQIKAIYLKAVEAGYDGTYEEWLETIKGQDGTSILFDSKDPESDDGKVGDFYLNINSWDLFVKTENGWVKVGNILGKDGKDGDTPYIGENGNWWVGDKDLGVPAQGPQGEPGQNGQQGEPGQNGQQGEPGQNGQTPYIGENGNWWIGDTDTKVPATGPQGEPGQNGQNGQNGKDGDTPYIGQNGNWWIGDKDLGVPATGPQGEPGQNGSNGQNGKDGDTPYIGENGNWWIGDTDTKVPATGPQGEPGQNGENGQNGQNGKDGDTPYIGQNGNWWVGDKDLGVPAQGPQGQQGEPGQNGQNGQNGENGQTAWSNTILPSFHGYVDVNVGSALEGDTIVFTAHRDWGYDLVDIYLNGESYIEEYDRDSCTLTVEMVKNGYVVRPVFDEFYYHVYYLNSFGDIMSDEWVRIDSYTSYNAPEFIYGDDGEYEFVGWDRNFIPVTGDTTYTANYVKVQSAIEKYGTVHAGTEEDPFDNADAVKVARNLRSEDRNKYFYIEGTIERFYHAPENRSTGYCSWFMTPGEEGEEQFEIYSCSPSGAVPEGFTWETIGLGDHFVVRATLTVYSGSDQPETNNVELIVLEHEPNSTWSQVNQATVAEARQYGAQLRDCENSPSQFEITAYVVDYDSSYYYIADEASKDASLPRLRIKKYNSPSFNMYDKIRIVDFVRNYHGDVEFNADRISEKIAILESGQQWNDLPKRVSFLYNGDYVPDYGYFSIEVGATVYLDMEFDIEDFSAFGSLRVKTGNKVNNYISASIVDGKLCLTGLAEYDNAFVSIINKNGSEIGGIYVYITPHYDPLEGMYVAGANEEKVIEAQYSESVIITLNPIPSTARIRNATFELSDETMLQYNGQDSENVFCFYSLGKEGDVTITFTDGVTGITETVTVRLYKYLEKYNYIFTAFENGLNTMFEGEENIIYQVYSNIAIGGIMIDETYEEAPFGEAAALFVPETMTPYGETGGVPWGDSTIRWQYYLDDDNLVCFMGFCSKKDQKAAAYQIQVYDAELVEELDNFTYYNFSTYGEGVTRLNIGDFSSFYGTGRLQYPAGPVQFEVTDPSVLQLIDTRVEAIAGGESTVIITLPDGRVQRFDFTVVERTGTANFYFAGIENWDSSVNVYLGVNGKFKQLSMNSDGYYYGTFSVNEVTNTVELYMEQNGQYFHPYSGSQDYDTMNATIDFSGVKLQLGGTYTITFDGWAYSYDNWEHAWFNYTVSEGRPNVNPQPDDHQPEPEFEINWETAILLDYSYCDYFVFQNECMQTTGKVYYVPEIESLFFEGMDLFAKVIEIDENLYLCNASSHEGLGTVFMIDWEENRIYDYKLDENLNLASSVTVDADGVDVTFTLNEKCVRASYVYNGAEYTIYLGYYYNHDGDFYVTSGPFGLFALKINDGELSAEPYQMPSPVEPSEPQQMDLSYFVDAVNCICEGKEIECDLTINNLDNYIIVDDGSGEKITNYLYQINTGVNSSEMTYEEILNEYAQYLPEHWNQSDFAIVEEYKYGYLTMYSEEAGYSMFIEAYVSEGGQYVIYIIVDLN